MNFVFVLSLVLIWGTSLLHLFDHCGLIHFYCLFEFLSARFIKLRRLQGRYIDLPFKENRLRHFARIHQLVNIHYLTFN